MREPLLAAWFADHPATRAGGRCPAFRSSLAPLVHGATCRREEAAGRAVARPVGLAAGLRSGVERLERLEVRYLQADDTGEYLFQAARWLGWLPLAAAFLWLREQIVSRSRTTARALDRSAAICLRAERRLRRGMIGKLLLSTLPFALALPAAAQAQGDDAAYCAQVLPSFPRRRWDRPETDFPT